MADSCYWLYDQPGRNKERHWWEDDLPPYVFLPRAFLQVAEAEFGDEWTGEELMAMEITKGSTRVYVDPKRCIANAKCTAAAPGVYVLDEETGVAVIDNPDDATVEQLFAGARACPTQAIIIEQFGRRVYPTILTPMFGTSKTDEDRGDE